MRCEERSIVPSYPESLEIPTIRKTPNLRITPPGSKSLTNRALVLAALSSAGSPQIIQGALRSEDTEICVAALQALGYEVHPDWANHSIRVFRGDGPVVPRSSADLFLGNSGTSIRFLTALLALGKGTYRLDGIPRMRERPIGDLLSALEQLGTPTRCEGKPGFPPIVLESGSWKGGRIQVAGDVSSQFLSGLLMAAPFAPCTTIFEVQGEQVSQPYVEMTRRLLHQWHLTIQTPRPGLYIVPGEQPTDGLAGSVYPVEPDASAASYFFGAAAITGGRITIPGLSMHSLQGDVCFVDVLERMGCRVERGPDFLAVEGGDLTGIDVGMNDISDTVMTLSAVALFARGPTTIRNVAHIRHKETDRVSALARELTRLGASVEEREDGLTIHPAPLRGTRVETYNDHRMAMSLSLVGLKIPGVIIADPGCVAKTYPNFFEDLAKLG